MDGKIIQQAPPWLIVPAKSFQKPVTPVTKHASISRHHIIMAIFVF